GNDSMLSHLAAFMEIPILTISTGPVRPHDSIPYAVNSVTVSSTTNCFPCQPDTKCELLTCHKDIPHNLIIELCDTILKGDEVNSSSIKEKVNVFHLSNIKIYKTVETANNSLQLLELTSNELNYSDTIK